MFLKKEAIAIAVLLGATVAWADTSTTTLDPSAVTAADAVAAPRGLIMSGLDALGVAKPIDDLGFNIYGWVESGYSVNLRRYGHEPAIIPGPFNHEVGNHYMLNQVDIALERKLDQKKPFDLGGKVEFMYGTDANAIHANGLTYGNEQYPGKGGTAAADDRYNPMYQIDVVQAYLQAGVPVGEGYLSLKGGKFVTLLSYETIAPVNNPFYSHSYLFNAVPFTQTGILLTYQYGGLTVTGGITRGWDQGTEDNNGAVDGLFQVGYWLVKDKLQAILNVSTGPQNDFDNAHWRTVIDPVIVWQLTDKLKVGGELMYWYDGGGDMSTIGYTGNGTYGDRWGTALYAGYTINDMITLNARAEWLHDYSGKLVQDPLGGAANTNVYEITAGATITPLSGDKTFDKILSNIQIRPEIRYDFSEDKLFTVGDGRSYRDQWTLAADVIVKF